MAGTRDKAEEIVLKLRQVEVLQGQGKSIANAVRHIGMAQRTGVVAELGLLKDSRSWPGRVDVSA